jgi:tRNA nucleotidyltransferase (CCA-adding enzyme)
VNWRNVRPYANGDDLKQLHIVPGPKYKEILNRLRAAWLDGDVKNREDERMLLKKLAVS